MALIGSLLFVVVVVSLVALFFRSTRPIAKFSAPLAAIAFVVAAIVSGGQMEDDAKAKGFINLADMKSAHEAGIADPAKWREHRSQQLSQPVQVSQKPLPAINTPPAPNTGQPIPVTSDPVVKLPSDQTAFIKIIDDARARYKAGENDLQKGAARPARAKAICSAIKGGMRISGWVGTLKKVSTNSDGKGVVTISISENVNIKTSNNAMTEANAETLIEPDSDMYNALLNLKLGSTVRVSGMFFSSSSDCVEEMSLTMNGSLMSPDFLVKFSRISPAVSASSSAAK